MSLFKNWVKTTRLRGTQLVGEHFQAASCNIRRATATTCSRDFYPVVRTMAQRHFSASVPWKATDDSYISNNTEWTVSTDQKITDLGCLIDRAELCMVTTITPQGRLASRMMGVAGKEKAGVALIFFTNLESTKIGHINVEPRVNLSFTKHDSGEWASLSGDSEVIRDRKMVQKYYSPTLKAWFGDRGDGVRDGGPNDPRIGILRVTITDASYAIVQDDMLGRRADSYTGDFSKIPRINRLRHLTSEEIAEWVEEI